MPTRKPKPADKSLVLKRHEPDWAALDALTDENRRADRR